MNCKYCASWNAEDEHRCTRCGRRLTSIAVSSSYPVSRSAAARSLEFADRPSVTVEVKEPAPRIPVNQRLPFEPAAGTKIIPFESFAAHRVEPRDSQPLRPAGAAKALPRPASAGTGRLTKPQTSDAQRGLDFLVPPPQGPRTLKTQVEAVIYCDADVAAPKHRAIAAAIDGGMIFVGFGLFLFAFHLMGGMFRLNRQTIPFFIGAFSTLAMFYGMLWIWADRQTVGMRLTGLRLIDFDGSPADRRARVLRAAGACLSFCAGGLGLLWALADEEKLAWHDHMSKTFPTIEESDSTFLRRR